MIEELSKMYEKLFLIDGYMALSEAVGFLLDEKKAKTRAEIAKKTGISASTLTAYISGDKTISKTFREKLKQVYQIDLYDPQTYRKDSDLINMLKDDQNPIDSASYVDMYIRSSEVIRAQQQIIEGLRKTNAGLKLMNSVLYSYIKKNEVNILKTELKK